MRRSNNRLHATAILALSIGLLSSSCAVIRAGSHASDVFMREGDPELAKAALPTMMKAAEALYLADPGDPSKALTVGQLYVMYANAFIDAEAFILPDEAFEERQALGARANALYLRAAAVLVPAVEAKAKGAFSPDADAAKASLARLGRKDVPLLYWTAAAVMAAFAGDPMNFDNAGRVGNAIALFERARELEPDWNGGGLHELAITIYGSLPVDLGGDRSKAKAAFETAVALTNGGSPGPYVAYAQAVCVPEGDAAGFESALSKALGLPDRPEAALMDTLARRKAKRLLDDKALYF